MSEESHFLVVNPTENPLQTRLSCSKNLSTTTHMTLHDLMANVLRLPLQCPVTGPGGNGQLDRAGYPDKEAAGPGPGPHEGAGPEDGARGLGRQGDAGHHRGLAGQTQAARRRGSRNFLQTLNWPQPVIPSIQTCT